MISALPVLSKKPSTTRIAYGVIITWTSPNNSLNETALYNVECFLCYEKSNCNTSCYDKNICSNITCNNQSSCSTTPCINEIYHPRAKKLTQTRVTVSNLTVGERYIFRVYPINSLNDQVSEDEWSYNETYPVEVSLGKEINEMEGSQCLYKQKSHKLHQVSKKPSIDMLYTLLRLVPSLFILPDLL